ncbi:MAG TPA: MarR family transcriptional regulator [Microbacteriaceae bacterium]|nr:MarR family transcriptional regulator [Microbacteriaceae bacterium]
MQQKVPRMDATEARAWVALVSVAELLPATLDQQLTDDIGLINFEYGILSMLNVADGQTLRMGELAAAVKSPAPRLSKAVTRLERKGFVERASCAGDGRAINVRLTRDGRRVWLSATPPHISLARDTILGDLTPDELTRLAELLEVIKARLDPDASLGRIPERAAPTHQPDHSL